VKISVLIAAYNAGAFIARALESVRTQRHADWELIVVEDGSHDDTEALVAKFAASVSQSVRYDNAGVNRGVAAARNRLLELAEGEALAFLDADDWWSPRHLESIHAALETGADLAVAGIELFDLVTDRPLGRYAPPEQLFLDPTTALFENSCIMTCSSIALTRAIVARVGRFDSSFQIGEDRDFWVRCALAGARFADARDVTCHYAKHATSTMGKTLLWAQQEVAFYEKYRAIREVPDVLRRDRLAHCLANFGRLQRAADPVASTCSLWRAWKLAPWRPSLVPQLVFSAGSALRPRRRGPKFKTSRP